MASSVPMPIPEVLNPMTEGAFSRLIKAVGRDKGLRVGAECLVELQKKELRTANDLLAFANYLIKQGGVVEAVGRALKVSALLRGAVETPRAA